jgi:peroxiredoxin
MRAVRIPGIWLCLALVLGSPAEIRSGTPDGDGAGGAPSESAIAARIREAWSELHRLKKTATPEVTRERQRQLAQQLFSDYLRLPESTAGQQALASAFRIWGDAADAAAIEGALGQVDRGSRHWVTLLRSARSAFVARDRIEDFRERAAALAAEITEATVAAAVWIDLGRDFRDAGEPERAADCFRQALAREPGPSLAATADAALRAIDRLAPGREAPLFTAVALGGKHVELKGLRGRAVVLQFWSVECKDCYPELDRLQRLREAHPRSRLELVSVALDSDVEVVRKTVEARGADWLQIVEEPQDGPGRLARLYEVRALPQAYLLDRSGGIVLGTSDGVALEAAVAELLAEEAASSGRLSAN